MSIDPYTGMLDANKAHIYFGATRYRGSGLSYTSSTTKNFTIQQILSGDADFNTDIHPHVVSLNFVGISNSHYTLFSKGSVPNGLLFISDVSMPDIEGCRYVQNDLVDPYTPSGESEMTMIGWRMMIANFYSYPEGDIENYDTVPTFQQGQSISFNLTMKKPNGETVFNNTPITLNFV